MGKGWEDKKKELNGFLNEFFRSIAQTNNPVAIEAKLEDGKPIIEITVPATQDKGIQGCREQKQKENERVGQVLRAE